MILTILKCLQAPLCILTKESDVRKCRIRCAIADFLVFHSIDVRLLAFEEDHKWHLLQHTIFKKQTQENVFVPNDVLLLDDGELYVSFYWAHHLRGGNKKKTIRSLAKTLELRGFCVTGWPGVFAVQGSRIAISKFHDVMTDQDRWKWRKLRKTIEFRLKEPIFSDWVFVDVDPNLNRDRRFQFGDVGAVMNILRIHGLERFFDIALCLT
eukprot:TRINITY_DN1984_c0_g1_i1.p1 TRINITY_DN1984_c0_g1~~TRINITY_DN1984_c0_g1_i1.p1  ORF type:complete len:210 (+),score=14.67 TRINITY_DN1984_c0_g1_i1:374-1003(+)